MKCITCDLDMAFGSNQNAKWYICRKCGYFVELQPHGDKEKPDAGKVHEDEGQVCKDYAHGGSQD